MCEKSNCFFFAWWLWLKKKEGYLAIRWTRPPLPYGWHWVYIPNGKKLRIIHYEPIDRKETFWKAVFHKFWYKGRIRHYDTKWKE